MCMWCNIQVVTFKVLCSEPIYSIEALLFFTFLLAPRPNRPAQAQHVDEIQASEIGQRDMSGENDITMHPSIIARKDILKQAGQNAILTLLNSS